MSEDKVKQFLRKDPYFLGRLYILLLLIISPLIILYAIIAEGLREVSPKEFYEGVWSYIKNPETLK